MPGGYVPANNTGNETGREIEREREGVPCAPCKDEKANAREQSAKLKNNISGPGEFDILATRINKSWFFLDTSSCFPKLSLDGMYAPCTTWTGWKKGRLRAQQFSTRYARAFAARSVSRQYCT